MGDYEEIYEKLWGRKPPRVKEQASTGLCPLCKRYLDDHDLLKGKPICPK